MPRTIQVIGDAPYFIKASTGSVGFAGSVMFKIETQLFD